MVIDWPAIVRQHGSVVWKTAFRLLLNEPDVSDCFQETFLSAMEFSRKQKVSNWPGLLQRIATARALDLLRRRIREQNRQCDEKADTVASLDADPLQEAEAAELSDRLRSALTQLPANQGQAFCLRHLNGLEYEEIAAEMKISVDAAGALLHRARSRLGELLLGAAPTDLKTKPESKSTTQSIGAKP